MSYEITPEESYELAHKLAHKATAIDDPRRLLESTPIASFDDVQDGDFIGKESWQRPRRVELVEQRVQGHVVFLAEPDPARVEVNGCRVVDQDTWDTCQWVRYPNLRALWDAAHAFG